MNSTKFDFSAFGESIQLVSKKVSEIEKSIIEFLTSFQAYCSEISESLSEIFRPLIVISDLGEAQFVFWDFLSPELIDIILTSENVNITLSEFCARDDFKKVKESIKNCSEHTLLIPYKNVFTQTICSFNEMKYDLATIGLLSIIDGLLSDVSENATTSFFKRANAILEKAQETNEFDSHDFSIVSLALTFNETMESLSTNQFSFTGEEPMMLNRHWIMHGRSRRDKTKLDCIKLINFVYGIILIYEFNKTDCLSNTMLPLVSKTPLE